MSKLPRNDCKPPMPKRQVKFKKRLEQTLTEDDLGCAEQLVQTFCQQLNISTQQFAAALLVLTQPQLCSPEGTPKNELSRLKIAPKSLPCRLVCYRLEVGSEHRVRLDDIKNVLVQESGVDKNRIGKVDIYPRYTLVELPDGMPADIFQLLSEAELAGQKLSIKRVRPPRRSRSFSSVELKHNEQTVR